jgi:ATP-dependent helicase/nuclease subunit B
MLAVAAALDHKEPGPPLKRPDPRPSVDLRPKRLSVTRIETLRRDPYAIFAEYILKLKPLAPLGVEIGAREMGTAIHAALEKFVSLYPHGLLPKDARKSLHDIARAELRDFFTDPAFVTFTWPRLVTGLDHALSFEHDRRAAGAKIYMEAGGAWSVELEDGSLFSLTAKADRIEVDAEGKAYVFDYKTGAPPSKSQVEVGWSPQLTLEAAMVEAGAFSKVGAHPVVDAAYVGLKGEGKTQWIRGRAVAFPELVVKHRAELRAMLSQFRNVETPYPSRPYVALVARAGDYDHLARVKEWSRGGGDGA